jgi:membrane-bound lytic murein transglycosylase B
MNYRHKLMPKPSGCGYLIRFSSSFLSVILSLILAACTGNIKNAELVNAFKEQMTLTHHFDKAELDRLFDEVEIKDDIIKKMTKPAEGLPWYRYRKIFLTDKRIDEGVKFWRENEQVVTQIANQYGVPAEIMIAIIGVETSYGQNTGNFRVIDALSTLAFAYPPRSKFFTKELESFLLICRDEGLNPLEPLGSYAGAMGMPQFMPSSFSAYATDFNNNGRRDIWHDTSDVLASIGNYFAKHGWQKDQMITLPIIQNEPNKADFFDELKPDLRIEELQSAISKISRSIPLNTKVKILGLKQEHGEELWATLENFYVITRYNHSPLYAMAVYQLSQALSNKKQTSSYE